MACATEDDRRSGALDVEDPSQCGGLVGPGDDVRGLADQRRRTRVRCSAFDLDAHRIGQVAFRDAVDPTRHGRREQHGLAAVGCGLEDRLDVLGEAHVEHLVRLVEDHHLDGIEWQGATVEVVECAARGGDDDIDSPTQGVQLATDRLPAVDRQDLRPDGTSVAVHRLRDLHRKLTRRNEDQGGRTGAVTVDHTLQDRQSERGRLARSRRGLTQQISTLEQRRDGLTLDGCRLLVAQLGERREQLRAESQVHEARCDRLVRTVCVRGSVPGGLLDGFLVACLDGVLVRFIAGHRRELLLSGLRSSCTIPRDGGRDVVGHARTPGDQGTVGAATFGTNE